MHRTLSVLAASAVLLTGCAAPAASTRQPAASATATVEASSLLAKHGLAGLDVRQLIDKLDASEDDRANGPAGSVRPTQLVLTDGASTATLPMPADAFYLSIAPYVTTTHDCFNHSLSSCKGELANAPIHVTVVDAAGAVVLNKDVTTYANGFAGLWLPKNLKGTLTVTASGKQATSAIGTTDADPTCLTTLQLH